MTNQGNTNSASKNGPSKLGSYESNSSMPLQLLLYINVLLYPFWTVINALFLYLKFECLGNLTQFLSVAVFIMLTSIECIRLYLGYLGNLSERIPELAGFLMLSVLLQLPLESFQLGNPYLLPKPIEVVMNTLMLVILLSELFFGIIALRLASSRAKEYFSFKSYLRRQIQNDKVKSD